MPIDKSDILESLSAQNNHMVGYTEFNHARLAAIYDAFNSLKQDGAFWLKTIANLGVQRIADLGCGTGLLTNQLAGLGYQMTGIDPAVEMLLIAKRKTHADKIQWRVGSSEQLLGTRHQLVIMTSHVAQFFITESAWEAALRDIYQSLNVGGYLLFDSRNPVVKPWEQWNKASTYRLINTSEGNVASWIVWLDKAAASVKYDIHYLFESDKEHLVSHNVLVFRDKDQLVSSLECNGFAVRKIYGDWHGTEFCQNSSEIIVLAEKISKNQPGTKK